MTTWLPLTSDIAFRAVFGQDTEDSKEALMGFLNDTLDLQVYEITHTKPFNLSDFSVSESHDMSFRAISVTGEVINIEIRMKKSAAMEDYITYLGSKLISKSVGKNDDQQEFQRCKLINISDEPIVGDSNSPITRFLFKERYSNIELTDMLEIICINPSLIEKDCNVEALSLTDKWLYLLQHSDAFESLDEILLLSQQSKGLFKAINILDYVSALLKVRASLKFKNHYEDGSYNYYHANVFVSGYQEGFMDGYNEGLSIGATKALEKLVKSAPDYFSEEELSTLTGLPLGQIRELCYSEEVVEMEIPDDPEEVVVSEGQEIVDLLFDAEQYE